MKFSDADVRKPLGAVSAIVDQGNTVVFSKGRSYIKSDTTGEMIPVVRTGGTYVIQVEVAIDETTKCVEVNGEEEFEDGGGGRSGSSGSQEKRSLFLRRAT